MSDRRILVALITSLAIAAGWSAPALATLSITIENRNTGDQFEMNVAALQTTSSLGTVRCNFRLSGVIGDTTVAVPLGSGEVVIGSVTSGSVSGCSPAWTWRLNGLPWPITIDAAALTGSAGQYELVVHDASYTVIGVTFSAPTLRARTNGAMLNLLQPATLTNVSQPLLPMYFGAQTWNIGPEALVITG